MPSDRLEPEYRDAFHAYRDDPSPVNAGALLKSIDPVISMGARTYGGGDGPLVRSRARRIALGALSAYDPKRSALKTHLMSHMQGLRRYVGRLEQPLSVPEQVLLDHRRLHATRTELADELGREPSDAELSDRARMSMKRMAYVRQYRPGVSEGQLHARTSDDEGGPMDPTVVRADPMKEYAEFLYHDLDPRDQVILEHAIGLHGKPPVSQKEVARMLGISPSAVTQRARRIQQQLDAISDAGLF